MALYSWFVKTNKNVDNQVTINKGMWPSASAAKNSEIKTLNTNKDNLLTTTPKHSVLTELPIINAL